RAARLLLAEITDEGTEQLYRVSLAADDRQLPTDEERRVRCHDVPRFHRKPAWLARAHRRPTGGKIKARRGFPRTEKTSFAQTEFASIRLLAHVVARRLVVANPEFPVRELRAERRIAR